MSEMRSSAIIIDSNQEQHSVCIDDSWKVFFDEKRVNTIKIETVAVLDGIVRAIDTVFDTRHMAIDIKNQKGLPRRFETKSLTYVRGEIPTSITEIIKNEELANFSNNLHVMGAGTNSCYMLTSDESSVDHRINVFESYTDSTARNLILAELRCAPLGQPMRRYEYNHTSKKSSDFPYAKELVIPEVKKAEPKTTNVKVESVAAKLSGTEVRIYQEALSRIGHMDLSDLTPYDVIVLEKIIRSSVPITDRSISDEVNKLLGNSYSEEKVESACSNLANKPYIGSTRELRVDTVKNDIGVTKIFRWAPKKPA